MKRIASLVALVVSLVAAQLSYAGEPTFAPLDRTTYHSICSEAMQAIDKLQTAGDIPKELWGEAIKKLKPLRVRAYHGHVMIALKEDETAEEGLFIFNSTSSYNIVTPPFLIFEMLTIKPDDKSADDKPIIAASINHYKVLKAGLDAPENGRSPFGMETNSSSPAAGQLP